MDTVQFQFAAPPAAVTYPGARADTVAAVAEVSGVMARSTDAPLPFPSGMGQTGEVNKSRMVEAVDNDIAPERVLKPWGLPMLPDLAKQEAEAEDAETEAEDAVNTTDEVSFKASGTRDVDAPAMAEVTEPSYTVDSNDPGDPATSPADPYVKED